MSTVQELMQQKINELERQNAALRRDQEANNELDEIVRDTSMKKQRKSSPVPLMKLRK